VEEFYDSFGRYYLQSAVMDSRRYNHAAHNPVVVVVRSSTNCKSNLCAVGRRAMRQADDHALTNLSPMSKCIISFADALVYVIAPSIWCVFWMQLNKDDSCAHSSRSNMVYPV